MFAEFKYLIEIWRAFIIVNNTTIIMSRSFMDYNIIFLERKNGLKL